MATWLTAKPRSLRGRYTLSFYSELGTGTGKLQLAGNGTNFVDVDDTAFTGSGQTNIDCGNDDTEIAQWQVVLTGDMVCSLLPRD